MTKRDEFLRATDSDHWRTIEEIVEALDRADHWRDQQPPAVEKLGHVRAMIATLRFGEDAPCPKEDPSDRTLVGQYIFVSLFRANESGALVRVYKQLMNSTCADLREVAEQAKALSAYHQHRADEALDASSASEYLIEELTEETMRRAWPDAGPEERRRIVRAALIKCRQFDEARGRLMERCLEEGLDVEQVVGDHMRAAALSTFPDATEINEAFQGSAEYLKLVVGMDNQLVDLFATMLLEAVLYTVSEFAESEGISVWEATQVFGGEFGERVDLFAEALFFEERDEFGWTLDEHLKFAVERAEASGQ